MVAASALPEEFVCAKQGTVKVKTASIKGTAVHSAMRIRITFSHGPFMPLPFLNVGSVREGGVCRLIEEGSFYAIAVWHKQGLLSPHRREYPALMLRSDW